MADFVHIKYFNRSASNQTDKGIAWMYENCPGMMEATLIAANGQKVKAHGYVLSMFSKYFEEKVDEVDVGWAVEIPLPNMSHEVVLNVVRLFYYREIFVPAELKPKMVEALKFLKTFDINVLAEDQFKQPMDSQIQAAKITDRRKTVAVMPENTRKRKVANPKFVEVPSHDSGASETGSAMPVELNALTFNGIGHDFSQLKITKVGTSKNAAVSNQLEFKKKVTKAAAEVKPAMPTGQSNQLQIVSNASANQIRGKMVKVDAAVQQLNEVKMVKIIAAEKEMIVTGNEGDVTGLEQTMEQPNLQDSFPDQNLQTIFTQLR